MPQNRFRSKVVIGSILAQIVVIGQLTGLWAHFGVDVGQLGNIIAAVLQLLVTFGVLNNPKDAKNF